MKLLVVAGIELGHVRRAVEARIWAHGVVLAQRRAVVAMEWDDAPSALYTVVREGRVAHEAVTHFAPRGGRLEFVFGGCTCRTGANCAHVVASVLTAGAGAEATGAADAHPPWERRLRALFSPEPPSLGALREPVPLAVELSLTAGAGADADDVDGAGHSPSRSPSVSR